MFTSDNLFFLFGLIFLLVVSSVDAAEAWGQCGGSGGSCSGKNCVDAQTSTCPTGFACIRSHEWYWQCVRTSDPPSTPPPPPPLPTGPMPFYCNCSQHLVIPNDGFAPNYDQLNAIFKRIGGFPTHLEMIERLDNLNAYNEHQSPNQKLSGAYMAFATVAKFKMVPPTLFKDECEAGQMYGQLKVAGVNSDAAKIKQLLSQKGLSTLGMSDQDLINLWGMNEHWNLHAVLFNNKSIRGPNHATSLSDKDQWNKCGFPAGGYNDRGEYPQWGWFEQAKDYNKLLGM